MHEVSHVYGITDLLTFALGTVFIVLLPGPNSVFVLTTASLKGIQAGYRAAAGVFVGDTILMLLAATGAASVLYANPTLFLVLKYAGAAYLSWIGVGLLRQTWQAIFRPAMLAQSARPVPAEAIAKETNKPNHRHPFRGALLISLLNPKAIFFFISFFVQFVDPLYAYPALTFLILGIIVQICSVAYLTALIFGGAHLASRMKRHPRLNALASGAVGAIFIAFGIKLADASLG